MFLRQNLLIQRPVICVGNNEICYCMSNCMNMYHLLSNNNTNTTKMKPRTRVPPSLFLTAAGVPKQVLSIIQILQDAFSHSLFSVVYKVVGLLFLALDHLACILFSLLIYPALTRHKS